MQSASESLLEINMSCFDRRRFLAASAAGAAFAAASPVLAQAQSPSASDSVSSLPQPDQRKGDTFEHDGARIFYQKTGSGSPMLLIHGYPLSGALFGRVVGPLSQNHTVVVPDLRGYGLSHAPAVTSSVEVYADDMLALMDKLEIKKSVVGGMSMGGPVVLAMYKKAPERFDGLVLIDTTFKKASPAEAGMWRGAEPMIEGGMEEDLTMMLLPQMLTGKTRQDDPTQVAYLKSIIKPASKVALLSGAKVLADRPDATAELATIKVPTLVVVGQDDALYSYESAQMMQGKIAGAQLHIVPGAAHAAIFENPGDAGGAIADWAKGIATK